MDNQKCANWKVSPTSACSIIGQASRPGRDQLNTFMQDVGPNIFDGYMEAGTTRPPGPERPIQHSICRDLLPLHPPSTTRTMPTKPGVCSTAAYGQTTPQPDMALILQSVPTMGLVTFQMPWRRTYPTMQETFSGCRFAPQGRGASSAATPIGLCNLQPGLLAGIVQKRACKISRAPNDFSQGG
jgi:hypothetical protein